MQEATLTRKVQVVASFLVSLAALCWLLSLPYRPHDVLPRLGFTCAVFCALGALIFSWAALFAYLIHSMKWSARACKGAGLIFLVPAIPFYIVGERWAPLLACSFTAASYICRRIGFPEVSDEEAFGPEPPLSLFSK
jgi:hypothetical protein